MKYLKKYETIDFDLEEDWEEESGYVVGDWVVVLGYRHHKQGNGISADKIVTKLLDKNIKKRDISGFIKGTDDFIVQIDLGYQHYRRITKFHIERYATTKEIKTAKVRGVYEIH